MSGLGQQVLKCDDPARFLKLWLDQPRLEGNLQATLESYFASFRTDFPLRMQDYYADQLREVTALVRGYQEIRILEVGSGCGSESLWLALNGADVLGLDVRADRVETANARAEVPCAAIGWPLDVHFETLHPLFASLGPVERHPARNWLAPLTPHDNFIGHKPDGAA